MINLNSVAKLAEIAAPTVLEALGQKVLSGEGLYNRKVANYLQKWLGAEAVFTTPSCTASLEFAALLCNVGPEDEVIMPSHTFVSTANAFALRGARLIFIDCDPKTLNIDVAKIADAISPRTKCIVPVHYAGVSCAMDEILELSRDRGILVVEDAAQCIGSYYKDKAVGSMGDISTFSFHNTKNIVCGEGGAIAINNKDMVERAEIYRDKGTDRTRFLAGHIDKYTWQDIGSSFLLSEIAAAMLKPQLDQLTDITNERLRLWNNYNTALKPLEAAEKIQLPHVPNSCKHNGHMFYILLDGKYDRNRVIEKMKQGGVAAVTHYVPLHSAPGGQKFGEVRGSIQVTEDISQRLIRLPLYYGLTQTDQDLVIDTMINVLQSY